MNDDEFRQSMATLELYRNQLNSLTQQSKMLQMTYEDVSRALETLKSVSKTKAGEELLIPIGGSIFVKATIPKDVDTVVNIGNNICVDKSLEDAIKFSEKNIEELKESLKAISEAITDVDTKSKELAQLVQQEYQRRQQ